MNSCRFVMYLYTSVLLYIAYFVVQGEEDIMKTDIYALKDNSLSVKKRSVPVDRVWYLELLLAVDDALASRFNYNSQRIHKYCHDIVNYVNAKYSEVNLHVVLVSVQILSKDSGFVVDKRINKTLDLFKIYKNQHWEGRIQYDVAHLISGISFYKKAGFGTVSGMCTNEAEGAVQDFEQASSTGVVLTHEIGHNFGLDHSDKECLLEKKYVCIMKAQVTFGRNLWSDDSSQSLQRFLNSPRSWCLNNKPQKSFEGGSCGNGIVEADEECDCGLEIACKLNNCCNTTTCTLMTGAVCGSGRCCDPDTCQPYPRGIRCRRALDECDLEESCNGESGECPEDTYKHDGIECNIGQGVCSTGLCVGHTMDCQRFFGQEAETAGDMCYQENTEGRTMYGNCGLRQAWKRDGGFKGCSKRNMLCGRLKCSLKRSHRCPSDHKIDGVTGQYYNGFGSTASCCSIHYNYNSGDKLGKVAEGSKCGENMFCNKDQECVHSDAHVKCSLKCNRGGVCNNKGHCHCNPGLRPPDCKYPGEGGSLDSGPETTYTTSFVQHGPSLAWLYSLFLLLIPATTGLGSLAYYKFQMGQPIFTAVPLGEVL